MGPAKIPVSVCLWVPSGSSAWASALLHLQEGLGALVTLVQEHSLVGSSCQGAWVGELSPGLGGCGIPTGDRECVEFHSILEVWGQYNLPASRTPKETLGFPKEPNPLATWGWWAHLPWISQTSHSRGLPHLFICCPTPRNSSCFLR